MSNVAFALDYAAAGWPVLPLHSAVETLGGWRCDCRPDGRCTKGPAKHPRTIRGLSDASTDPDVIRQWWGMWPGANIGLAVPESHVILDVDVDDVTSVIGDRALPTTALVRTGRGWQFVYATERPIRPKVAALEHIDLRGPGSYVIAPPSRHISGTEYAWISEPREGIAPAPAWLYELAAAEKSVPAEPGALIRAGERNARLASLAGTMRRQSMTRDEIFAALATVNAGRCDPPLVEAEVRKIAASVAKYPPQPDPVAVSSVKAVGIDAADLLAKAIPPLRWIVPDLLPQGTTVIASAPKVGKSCLVYQVLVETSIGGRLLGREVASGSGLYLALEDGERRGQERLRAALRGRTMPGGRLEVRWSAPKIGAGLEDMVARWLDDHGDAAVVAIDTLGKVRPRSDGRRNAYEVDVEDLGRLQDLFRDRPVALVIVHHARKESGDDFLASVSGTYGITGSADTIVAIRRKRLEAFGSIVVTGRDVPDAELPVRFDGLTWQSAPSVVSEGSFQRMEVYRVIEGSGPIFPAAIAATLGLSRTSVQNMTGALVDRGAVARTAKGYVVTGATIVPSATRAGEDPGDSSDSESHRSHGGHPREEAASVGKRMAQVFEGTSLDAWTPPQPDPTSLL